MIYAKNKQYTLYQMSCLDLMDSLEENSIDAIVTDPPYEIGFMNKGWDNTGIAFSVDTWKKALRILKPGGYLLAFNHSRTFHRMMVAIEDAGFELRDTIMWLYGSGFPKSHNVGIKIDKKMGVKSEVIGKGKSGSSNTRTTTYNMAMDDTFGGEYKIKKPTSEEAKQWDGWGTALKPAFEPIVMARKPFKGSVAENILKYGVGGINIDECRIPFEDTKNPATNPLFRQQNKDKYKQVEKNKKSNGIIQFESSNNETSFLGRFPANIIHDGSEEVVSGFPNTKSGDSNGFVGKDTNKVFGKYANNIINPENVYGDEGNASRYFYCAKASVKDRDDGLELLNSKFTASAEFRPNHMEKALNGENGNPCGRWQPRKNIHPTVKPTKLMQYLVRLVTPKGGTILDIFMGSGSTGKATMIENVERNSNYHFIGVDLDQDDEGNTLGYCEIAKARIDFGMKFKDIEKEQNETMIDYDDNGTPMIVKQIGFDI